MNDYRISLTQRAKDDIINIGDYITYSLHEQIYSKKFIKALRNSISQLKLFPYKFPLIQDDILQNEGIRCMPYKNYCIFYKIVQSAQIVIVLRIGHKQRNWKDILA